LQGEGKGKIMKIRKDYLEVIKNNGADVEKLMEQYHVPGMGVTVIEAGKPVFSGVYGCRDDKGTAMTEDTLFECASLTKSLFATLVMRLAEQGRLELEKPVAEQYEHEHWSADPRYLNVTPLHCLSHGTGFPNWGEKPLEFGFDPGTAFSYSGEGYYLLQHMVQQLEGRPLEESFKENFYEPWKMTQTAVDWTPEVGKCMSWGFDAEGKVCKIRDAHDDEGLAPEPNAAWSLYSNTADYAEFLCRMINGQGGLSEESFAAMTTPHNRASYGVSWGLGFGLVDAAPGVCWHWGDNGGFKNFAVWDKNTGDGAVIFTNGDSGMDLYVELLKELTDGTFFDDVKAFIQQAE